MKDEARKHLMRARRLLGMVESRAEIELPEVVAHSAYYAMYHAATALFIENGFELPKTHSGMVTRLSQIERDKGWNAKIEIARLSRALDRRLIADYRAEDTLTIDHARSARDEAVAFISFCERALTA